MCKELISGAKSKLDLKFSEEADTVIKTVLSSDVFKHNVLEPACYAVFFYFIQG
jgi:hypothetical protein